jgi:hypothetical protein
MRNAIVCFAAIAVAGLVLVSSPLQAAEPMNTVVAHKAATAELPLALRAVGANHSQVLDSREAEQVRGQWWIFIPRTAGDIFYQGIGSGFVLNPYLESESYPPYMVGLRISIGQ